jgi:hypothetical protein
MATNQTKCDLTAEQVRSMLDYDPAAGILTWRWRDDVPDFVNSRDVGRPAGHVHRKATGHMKLGINGSYYFYHRVVWLHVMGEWPTLAIDHIDGDPQNNRITNLRLATTSQNQMNQKKTYCVGLKGARYHKQSGRWQASIIVNGKSTYLGLFDTPEAAHEAYCEAAARLHGEFARVA